jgi:hypothetical protein
MYKKILLLVGIFWVGIAVAHIEQAFEAKTFSFKSYADTYSVSLNNDNFLGINRNGQSIFQVEQFCEIKDQ